MLVDLIILISVVLIASFLQASTGYGFSIIGTPFLLMLYLVHEAIQINIILSIFLSLFMMVKIRTEIDRPLVKLLMKGSAIGMIGGIFIYLYLDVQWLKFTVGMLTLMVTLLLILQVKIIRTKKRDAIVGGFSGLLTTSIGVPGPPLLLYLSGTSVNQYTLRSTTLAYYLFVYTSSLIMQLTFGGTNKVVWLHSFIAIPALLVGIISGQLFIKWISQTTFRLMTYIILIFTGIYLVLSSF